MSLRRVVVVLCLLSACTGGGSVVDPTPAPGPADPLLQIARQEGAVDVVVQLAVPRKGGSWEKSAVARAQGDLIAELGPRARVMDRFGRRVPQLLLSVNAPGLRVLRRSPVVVNITLHESK